MGRPTTERVKPVKPYPEFPLFPAPNGQWAKKIRGKPRYFGVWADWEAAEKKYLAEKEHWYAGRKPPTRTDGLLVHHLVNQFLTAKEDLVDQGEITFRYFSALRKMGVRLAKQFGRDRPVEDLTFEDFDRLRKNWPKGWGPGAVTVEMQKVVTLFKWGYDTGLLDKPVRLGPNFKRPSQKVMRKVRQDKGPILFTDDEIRQMLAMAHKPMKAMILLGINCGLGNYDVSCLPIKSLDLDAGFHTFGRPKTGMPRRCPLWPETVAALKEAIAERPAPHDPQDAGAVFLTKAKGTRYVRLRFTR